MQKLRNHFGCFLFCLSPKSRHEIRPHSKPNPSAPTTTGCPANLRTSGKTWRRLCSPWPRNLRAIEPDFSLSCAPNPMGLTVRIRPFSFGHSPLQAHFCPFIEGGGPAYQQAWSFSLCRPFLSHPSQTQPPVFPGFLVVFRKGPGNREVGMCPNYFP